jgi:hypothetical protein
VTGDGVVGPDAELGEHSSDEHGIVARMHSDGIACLVGDSGVREVELVVADLLVGLRCGEQFVDDQSDVDGMVALPARRRLGLRRLGSAYDDSRRGAVSSAASSLTTSVDHALAGCS